MAEGEQYVETVEVMLLSQFVCDSICAVEAHYKFLTTDAITTFFWEKTSFSSLHETMFTLALIYSQ